MKKIVIIFTAFALLLFLSSCNKNLKPVTADMSPGDSNTKTETPSPTSTPTPSPTPTKAPSPTPTKTPTPKPTKTQVSSSGLYDVKVDLSEQKVYVSKGDKLVKTFICSAGIEGDKDTETPVGEYKIKHRGTWFFSQKYQEGAKYWVGFIGTTYLFHSLAMDKNQKIIEEEAEKLGTPASHGCIRMAVADAKWFYDNVKDGSKVVIQK